MRKFQNEDTYLATVCSRRCPPKKRPPRKPCGNSVGFVCCKDGKRVEFCCDEHGSRLCLSAEAPPPHAPCDHNRNGK